MDKGISVQNPYGNVTIPRAQLKNSFIRETLGEDLDGVVITNTSAVPSYPTYITQDPAGNSNSSPSSPDGYKVHTQESWRRPYNPYGGEKPQNGAQGEAMYSIDLDKQYKDVNQEEQSCCCSCCPCCTCPCSCCPCCSCCKPCCCIC